MNIKSTISIVIGLGSTVIFWYLLNPEWWVTRLFTMFLCSIVYFVVFSLVQYEVFDN